MVGHVASKDVHDPLNCIRLNGDGSTVGCNGKVIMAVGPVDMKRIHSPIEQQASPGAQGVSIPLDLLGEVIKILPKEKRIDLQIAAMTACNDTRKIQFSTTDMRHAKSISGLPKTSPFPNWRNLFKKARGVEGPRVCVNRRDLLDLLHALEEAAPDRGGENPVFIEINPEGSGMILRCNNRETNQRAIGAITAYNTNGQWMPADEWERGVFDVQVKKLIQ